MKRDVLSWSQGHPSEKLVSKETLNHRGLIESVSGLDVYRATPEAYARAYAALGIDIINRVPPRNAPAPTLPGQTRRHDALPYSYSNLGVYDTAQRHTYVCTTPDEVWALDVQSFRYEDLLTPVPHPCRSDDIRKREQSIGDIGLYYPMLYTTLFMWPVELLGWEVFMVAAAREPDRFHEHLLMPCAAKSKTLVDEMVSASDSPFLFVHDDLAGKDGPMFHPTWYDAYIFPHYPEIWSEAKRSGKKVIFVADGNMETFLPRLVEAGVDGLMFENPATSLDAVIEHFGQPGRFLIGGIDTARLTLGTPDEARRMVFEVAEKMEGCPGFAISSCGGIHGNIPLDNLAAYFDARAEIGATPAEWRVAQRRESS
jgi:hypothetical protein